MYGTYIHTYTDAKLPSKFCKIRLEQTYTLYINT